MAKKFEKSILPQKLDIMNLKSDKKNIQRPEFDKESTGKIIKNHTTSKTLGRLTSNQQVHHPLLGTPYRNGIKLSSLPDNRSKSASKSDIGQRVSSAKMLRIKQLQNQLADAHYHLNELSNENKLLKAIQKRQDSALKRYEGTNAELPRIIDSHHEELKIIQAKHKKLKAIHKETCESLKEKENEIFSLQAQNKHLMRLSKDRHLEEREQLQFQVSDLNHKIQEQHETIQNLHRRLALERKSLKQQLKLEISKHKETRKSLLKTINKLKYLEDYLDNRGKRMLQSDQLLLDTTTIKEKTNRSVSQSLMNLKNPSLPSYGSKRSNKSALPLLAVPESYDRETMNSRMVRCFNEDENILKLEDQIQTSANEFQNCMKQQYSSNIESDCSIDENPSSELAKSLIKSQGLHARLISGIEDSDTTKTEFPSVERSESNSLNQDRYQSDSDLEFEMNEYKVFNQFKSEDNLSKECETCKDLIDAVSSFKETMESKDSESFMANGFSSNQPHESINLEEILNNTENGDTNLNDVYASLDQLNLDTKDEYTDKSKTINYDKEKLLASIKAIDDNENIENPKRNTLIKRNQITENLYLGLPTHAKKEQQQDLIKGIFSDIKIDNNNKSKNNCGKLH